jgi:hypothetical protein
MRRGRPSRFLRLGDQSFKVVGRQELRVRSPWHFPEFAHQNDELTPFRGCDYARAG